MIRRSPDHKREPSPYCAVGYMYAWKCEAPLSAFTVSDLPLKCAREGKGIGAVTGNFASVVAR